MSSFKTQKQKFINQGFDESLVDDYLNWFREIKDKKYKQVFDDINGVSVIGNNRINVDAYKTFDELEKVVDYVRGQVSVKGVKIDEELIIDGKPLYENNTVEIYYADSPRACIKYKGNVPYSWCVARPDSSNMYYTYRMKEHVPTFYFIKIKDRTKKELGVLSMLGNVFNGEFKDKYHFFVVQVLKNADVNNKTQEQYLVTSAMNDGEIRMSWDDILKIEPRLSGLQGYLNPVPLTDKESYDYKTYRFGISDEAYAKLPYDYKRTYIDVYVKIDRGLTDNQFQNTPSDLKNLYISLGAPLTAYQYSVVKQDKNLYKRFVQISERFIQEALKDVQYPKYVTYYQLESVSQDLRDSFLTKVSYIGNLIKNIPEENYMEVINAIIKAKGSNLSDDNVYRLLGFAPKENIMEVVNAIIKAKGGNLSNDNVYFLLGFTSKENRMEIINAIIKLSGSKLSDFGVKWLLLYTPKENMYQVENLIKKYIPDYFKN